MKMKTSGKRGIETIAEDSLAAGLGLEPRLADPESAVLPIRRSRIKLSKYLKNISENQEKNESPTFRLFGDDSGIPPLHPPVYQLPLPVEFLGDLHTGSVVIGVGFKPGQKP